MESKFSQHSNLNLLFYISCYKEENLFTNGFWILSRIRNLNKKNKKKTKMINTTQIIRKMMDRGSNLS